MRRVSEAPRLVLVVGRPGTGKTTLSRALVQRLAAAYVRIDAIETALASVRDDHGGIGVEGYAVAHLLAASNLQLGRDVVVDAVCPVPESRVAWAATAAEADGRLVVLQTRLPDPAEHRRRVSERLPDLAGQRVPSWTEVVDQPWEPWDVERDGPCSLIDTTSAPVAVAAALAVIEAGDPR